MSPLVRRVACAAATALVSLVACDSASVDVYLERYQGTLSVELRDAADVVLAVRPDKTVDVRVAFKGQTFGLVREGGLSAKGRVEPFPESAIDMYVANWSYSMPASSPCRGEPVSLALSLVRRNGNARVGGSLTAYCGVDKWHGVPVRILRLSGELPPG